MQVEIVAATSAPNHSRPSSGVSPPKPPKLQRQKELFLMPVDDPFPGDRVDEPNCFVKIFQFPKELLRVGHEARSGNRQKQLAITLLGFIRPPDDSPFFCI